MNTENHSDTPGRPTVIPSASALVLDSSQKVLLVERGNPENYGLWSLPGGKQEPNEALTETARREVFEETGNAVVVGEELWIQRVEVQPDRVYEIHVFAATPVSEDSSLPVASDDALQAAWFSKEEFQKLPLTEGLLPALCHYV